MKITHFTCYYNVYTFRVYSSCIYVKYSYFLFYIPSLYINYVCPKEVLLFVTNDKIFSSYFLPLRNNLLYLIKMKQKKMFTNIEKQYCT